jgi:flagellar motility protein MotE (MotC chaperone)
MEPMTPEERWTKFENAMQSLMESQARHDVEIARNEAAIRDLIIVSRAFLDSQKEMTTQIQSHDGQIEHLRQLHEMTTEKLNALIETVDRIIRNSRP